MIKNFEIVKYKCFENFKLEGLSRINIITGDNNVGKTALLEAVALFDIDNSTTTIDKTPIVQAITNRNIALKSTLFQRQIEAFNFLGCSETYTTQIEFKNFFEFSQDEKDSIRSFATNESQFLMVTKNDDKDFIAMSSLLNFSDETYENINSSKPMNRRLVKLYSRIQSKGLQREFLNYLKRFERNIKLLEPQLIDDEVYLHITLENPKISLVSSDLGEGVNRFIEILSTILTHEGKIITIDEIENGIYYKKFKDIWKAIIEIAQKEDVQLFVTTHNEDTIEALKEASDEVGFEDVCSIRLYKHESKIKASIYDYDAMKYNIDMGMELR